MNSQIAIIGIDPTFLVQTIFDVYRCFEPDKHLSKSAVIFWPKSSIYNPELDLNQDSLSVQDSPKSVFNQNLTDTKTGNNLFAEFGQENQLLAQEYLSKISIIDKIEDQIVEISQLPLTDAKNTEAVTNASNLDQSSQEWELEVIKTDNLVLKELSITYLDLIWQNWSNKVSYFLTQSYSYKSELEKDLLEKISQNKQKTRIDWAIMDREDGDFLGLIGIQLIPGSDLDMQFWLKESVWQQGFGSQAANGVYSWLQKNLQFKSLILNIEKNNSAAVKIAKNLGGQSHSEFSILKDDKALTFCQYQLKNTSHPTNKENTQSQTLDSSRLAENGPIINHTAQKIIIKTVKTEFEFEKVIMGKAFWQSLKPELRESLKNNPNVLIKNNENTEISDFVKNFAP